MPDVCPTLADYTNRYAKEIHDSFFDTREEVIEHVRKVMKIDPSSLRGFFQIRENTTISLLIEGKLEDAIMDMARLIEALHTEDHGGLEADFLEELKAVSQLTLESFIPVDRAVEEDTFITSPFDLMAWRRGNYDVPLSHYRSDAPRKITLRIPNMPLYQGIWENDQDTPLEKYNKNFLSINSANRRRDMVQVMPVG